MSKLKEFEVDVTEELKSCITVEAHDENEAYQIAMQELAKDFNAQCHYSCDVTDYTVIATGIEYEEDEDEL